MSEHLTRLRALVGDLEHQYGIQTAFVVTQHLAAAYDALRALGAQYTQDTQQGAAGSGSLQQRGRNA